MGKPIMMILTSPKLRNNTSISMYRYMKRETSPFDVRIMLDPGGDAQNSFQFLVDNYMGGDVPTHIVLGTWASVGAFTTPLNFQFVDNHKIKTIINIADVEAVLDMPETLDAFARWHFNAIWAPWKDHPELKVSNRLREFVDTFGQLGKTKILFEPWSYNEKEFYDPNYERTYHAFFSMSVNPGWPYHRNRLSMYKKLLELQRSDKTLELYGGAMDDKGHWHGIYGDRYLEGIRQSNAMIVDTSMRRYMTAKYLEAGASGAVLIGDAPFAHQDVFNEETMYPIEYGARSFGDVMALHLAYDRLHKEERSEKVKLMMEKVKTMRHEVIIPRIEEKILDL